MATRYSWKTCYLAGSLAMIIAFLVPVEIYKLVQENEKRKRAFLEMNQELRENFSSPVENQSNVVKAPFLFQSACWKTPCLLKKLDPIGRIFFVVKSAAGNVVNREILRRTWASMRYIDGYKIATIFVIGKIDVDPKAQIFLNEEYNRYGDILQLNISDKYRNISLKTLGGMQWALENLDDNDFYTSSDDDVLINMGELVNVLNWHKEMVVRKKWPEFPIICTYKARINDHPERKTDDKWQVPYDEYKWPYWPDYCLGGAYTTSVKVVRELYKVSLRENPLRMDDVWITGILREKMGMPRQFVQQLNRSVAKHYFGFRGARSQEKKQYVREEWEKVLKSFKNSTICECK